MRRDTTLTCARALRVCLRQCPCVHLGIQIMGLPTSSSVSLGRLPNLSESQYP